MFPVIPDGRRPIRDSTLRQLALVMRRAGSRLSPRSSRGSAGMTKTMLYEQFHQQWLRHPEGLLRITAHVQQGRSLKVLIRLRSID